MKRQITFILLIALTIAIPWNAWGDDLLLRTIDFTTMSTATYTSSSNTMITEGGITYSVKKDKNIKISNSGIEFDQNMSDWVHCVGIPVTGVNGTLKIVVNHSYNNKSASFKIGITTAEGNNPEATQTTVIGATNGSTNYYTSTKNENTFVGEATSLTGTDYIVWVGRNGSGYTTFQSIDIYTTAPSLPLSSAPSITTQPVGATYCPEAVVSPLSVEATGAGAITYQWYENTTVIIAEATLATYTPTATGEYYCVVTNTETDHSPNNVESDHAKVTILTSLEKPVISRADGTNMISITQPDGATVTYALNGGAAQNYTEPFEIAANATITATANYGDCSAEADPFSATYTATPSATVTYTVATNTTAFSTTAKTVTGTTLITTLSDIQTQGISITDNSAKSGLTVKIPVGTESDYLYATFVVADGYEFVVKEASAKVQPVSTDNGTYKIEVSDISGAKLEQTNTKVSKGSARDLTATSGEGVAMSGTVTVKIYAYGATDTYRLSPNITITGTVRESVCVSASITTHPENVTIQTGNTATLSVVAQGGSRTYQWQVKNSDWEDVVDATNANFTTLELDATQQYRCVVTAGCDHSTATSNPATVTVQAESTNAKLEGITIAGTALDGFDANTFAYTYNIAYNAEMPAIEVVKGEAAQTVTITPADKPTVETPTTATILVTAEDGTSQQTYTITFSLTIADKKLNQVIMSNGFDAFIKDGVITCYYLDGTSEPTISSTQVSDGATFDPATRTLTGSDGHAIVYTLNAYAVTPATAPKTTIFDGTETWIKTGYDYAADKGWRFSKNKEEAGNNRVTEGKNRLYFYVKNCQTLRLTSATSKRAVKVYVDGDELAELTETVASDNVFEIPVNKEGAAVVAIVSNQTGGDGGFKVAELVAMSNNLTVENSAEENVNAAASYNNVTVQPNGKLNVNAALTVSENLVLQANENARPQIEGANNITVNGSMSYEWTVTAGQDYPVSMPCDVNIADVKYWNTGTSAWDANFTMMIAEYDGEHRATEGEANAENPTNWKHTDGSIFAANKGYIIRVTGMTGSVKLLFPLNNLLNANNVTVTNSVTVQENAINPENAKVKDFDAGWNFVGNPFLAAAKASGLAGYITHNNGASYTLTENNVVPFTGMFVQVDNGTALTFTNSAADPIRAENQANTKVTVKIALDEADYLGLRIADTYTTAYELTHDLLKMFGSAQSLALYTLEGNTRLAYNAMPNDAANAIPVGFSATAGEHTIALINNPALEHLYLTDHLTGIVTDLLSSDYTFTTEGDSMNETRFELSAVRAEAGTATTIYDAYLQGAGVQKVLLDGKVYIIRNGVWYDVMGQVVK